MTLESPPVFALDKDSGELLALSSPDEAGAHCKAIDVMDGFWFFYADDGSPLEARFVVVPGESADVPGAYILQRALSGLWLQERIAQVRSVKGAGLANVAELVETLKVNRGKRVGGKSRT